VTSIYNVPAIWRYVNNYHQHSYTGSIGAFLLLVEYCESCKRVEMQERDSDGTVVACYAPNNSDDLLDIFNAYQVLYEGHINPQHRVKL
jgi:hypothetical protein